jgi:hypothetical protein
MEIRGASLADFEAAVVKVSYEYGGNLTVHRDSYQRGRLVRARVAVVSSREPGARRSWSGRRIPAACWHAYRDVLAALFEQRPRATVRTALAVYRGREGFEQRYPDTAYQNIGSQMFPAYMPQLCDCEDSL